MVAEPRSDSQTPFHAMSAATSATATGIDVAALQAWFGLSAGGQVDPQEAVDLLNRCGVAANPHQLDIDEGTFRGLLRHTVRFAVGEFLPYSVLNEADVNYSASDEMWRWCWRVPRVA